MDEGGVGEVHGPVAIAGHQGVHGAQIVIVDGGDRDGPRPDEGPRLFQGLDGPSGIMWKTSAKTAAEVIKRQTKPP